MTLLGLLNDRSSGSSRDADDIHAHLLVTSETGALNRIQNVAEVLPRERDISTSGSISTPADLIRMLASVSGLTLGDIAYAIGVSRRTIHLWLRGGSISTTNEERLRALSGLIAQRRGLRETPEQLGVRLRDNSSPNGLGSIRRDLVGYTHNDSESVLDRLRAEPLPELEDQSGLVGSLDESMTFVVGGRES